jgi:TrmH family RNA methyltransferase
VLSDSNARLAAARRLTSRRNRSEAGRFLAEGAQAVREALGAPGVVVELFATEEAARRSPDLLARAEAGSVRISFVSEKAAGTLSETVTPQGLVAVCEMVHVDLAAALRRQPRLVAVLVDANEPGNAGAVLRTADAAGAELIVLAGESVDIYNGKSVRATAGSIFHLEVAIGMSGLEAVAACASAGLQTLATSGAGETDLDALIDQDDLARPSAWFFGNEAHGLADELVAACQSRVRVPIHGRAESLNLAAAAAVCLYSSARAQRAS